MKYNIIFFVIFTSVYFSQTRDPKLPMIEIATRTSNFASTTEIRFKLEPVGTAWCLNKSTNEFYIDNSATSSEEIIVGNVTNSSKGFSVCYDNEEWEEFSLGLNKMTIYTTLSGQSEQEQTHFYLDHRDCHYGQSSGSCSNDISFKYDNSTGLYYSPGLLTNYTSFSEGDIINWWTVTQLGSFR